MRKISHGLKMVLVKAGLTHKDLADAWNTSQAAVDNKFYRDYWSGNELADIARITGSKLAFVFPDGQEFILTSDMPPRASARGEKKSD